jgi:NRPS condensation-like uncharacterized protein
MRIPLTTASEPFWLSRNKIPFNFAMMVRVRGLFTPADLIAALHCAAEQHPLARARLEIDSHGLPWLTTQGVPEINLRIANSDSTWEQVAEDELRCTFDPTVGPQVRAVWISTVEQVVYIVLVFNHNVCDGMSGAYFTRDLLQQLGSTGTQPLPPAVLSGPQPHYGDMVSLIPSRVARAAAVRLQMWAIHTLMPLAWMVQKRLPRPAQPEDVPRFCILAWALIPETTAALVARCRVEGTSVHAAVCAAWLRADAEIEGSQRWNRTVSTPVNLRGSLIGPVGDSFGLFMSTVTTRVSCNAARDFWEIAREIKRHQVNSLSGDRKFHWPLRTHAALGGLSAEDRRGALEMLSAQRPNYDLAVTNLGRLDFPTQSGSLHFEALYGPLVNGFPFERTVSLLTFGSVMHFAFAFRDFVLEQTTCMATSAHWNSRCGS